MRKALKSSKVKAFLNQGDYSVSASLRSVLSGQPQAVQHPVCRFEKMSGCSSFLYEYIYGEGELMLVTVMYLIYVSLGLPDSLLGSGWPEMQVEFGVPSSCAGYVFMSISFMTIISSLLSPVMIRKIHTWWIMVFSILLTVIGILGFSFSGSFYMLIVFAVPYGLGAGAIDAAVNHYVANNYSGRIMNFLHCFYGVGAIISPNIMAYALSRATWHEGYRWTAYIQTGIMVICILSLPLWKGMRTAEDVRGDDTASVSETIKVPGVILTLLAFFAYCSGEATCFVWTSSYFADTRPFLGKETVASFGSLIFLGSWQDVS